MNEYTLTEVIVKFILDFFLGLFYGKTKEVKEMKEEDVVV